MPSVGRRVAALAAIACVTAGVLSGCVGSGTKPSPTPKPTATPLYSSDAKALAAAKDAYARYVDVSNQVAHDGWADLAPLKTVATGDALKADQKGGAKNHAEGLKIAGDAVGSVKSVQRVSASSVTAYACADFSATRVVDANGIDQTSPNRVDVISYELVFMPRDGRLVVKENTKWSGDSFC